MLRRSGESTPNELNADGGVREKACTGGGVVHREVVGDEYPEEIVPPSHDGFAISEGGTLVAVPSQN